MVVDSRQSAAGVSDMPAEAERGGLGQTTLAWKVRSDQGDPCDTGPHSDVPEACWWRSRGKPGGPECLCPQVGGGPS